MARIETHGLRRTVGVGGLFATAYGNVGSSIYYALGLVAAYALGLTPVIFLMAGGLFAITAKTYAEGASMFPEAGGSSSFARHAFNEVTSFIAGWALCLDYILTIAISAFFVPHFPRRRPVAADPPGPPRHHAEVVGADLRGLAGDGRLHGDRDGLEHGRGGARPREGRPARGQHGARRRSRRVRRHHRRGALGAAGRAWDDRARHAVRERPGAGDRRPLRPLARALP